MLKSVYRYKLAIMIVVLIASLPLIGVAYAIQVGDTVQVYGTSPGCLNIRQSYSTSASVVTCVPDGTQLTVIGGPQNNNGYTWWNVKMSSGVSGWAVSNYLQTVSSGAPPPLNSGSSGSTGLPSTSLWTGGCGVSGGATSISKKIGESYEVCWYAQNVTSCTIRETSSATGLSVNRDSCNMLTKVPSSSSNYAGGPLTEQAPNYADKLTYTISAIGTNGSTIKDAIVDVINVVPPQQQGSGNNGPVGSGTGSSCASGAVPCFDIKTLPPSLPQCSFVANPSSIVPPQSFALSWSCDASTQSCIDPLSGNNTAPSGSDTVNSTSPSYPTQSTTYYLTCSNPNGDSTVTTTVNITKPFIKEVRP